MGFGLGNKMKRYEVRKIPNTDTYFEILLNAYARTGWEILTINNAFIVFVKNEEEE